MDIIHPAHLITLGDHGCSRFPLCHRVEAMQMGSESGQCERGETKTLRTLEKIETKRYTPNQDRNPCITRTRFQSGTWEISLGSSILCQSNAQPLAGSTFGSGVGTRACCSDHASGRNGLAFLTTAFQQALSSLCVAAGPEQSRQDIAILIDHTPQPTFITIRSEIDNLIQIPDVTTGGSLTLQSVGW